MPPAPISVRRRPLTAAVLVLALVAGGSCTGPAEAPVAGPTATPSGEEPAPDLFEVRLTLVRGLSERGEEKKRRLARPARSVRATLESLYAAAFVDAPGSDVGGLRAVGRFFAGPAREAAQGHLRQLTLGPLAERVSSLRPTRAALSVRFAVTGQPSAAFANLRFRGVGTHRGGRIRISQRGDYVLRWIDGAWRIVAYQVRGSIDDGGNPRPFQASFTPGLPKPRPRFYLVIGSDARRGEPQDRLRADSLHILAVNPAKRAATLVGIPRDSWVAIPGVGMRKINESLWAGGPSLAMRTVERLAGVRFDGYLLTGFASFIRAVSGVGGIRVTVPYPMSDGKSGAYFRKGVTRMNGQEALAFSRNRYGVPGGDFGRSLNQGRLLVAALKEFRSDLRKKPSTILRWLITGMRHVQTDLSVPEMLELLLAAATIEPRRVRNTVVSGSGAMIGGQSAVVLGAGAQAVFRDIRGDAMLGR